MGVEFDPPKDAANIAKHGVSLALADQFEFTTAMTRIDDRFDYSEVREISIGLINGRLHVLVYTIRNGVRRAISLRKANLKERQYYDDTKKTI